MILGLVSGGLYESDLVGLAQVGTEKRHVASVMAASKENVLALAGLGKEPERFCSRSQPCMFQSRGLHKTTDLPP